MVNEIVIGGCGMIWGCLMIALAVALIKLGRRKKQMHNCIWGHPCAKYEDNLCCASCDERQTCEATCDDEDGVCDDVAKDPDALLGDGILSAAGEAHRARWAA